MLEVKKEIEELEKEKIKNLPLLNRDVGKAEKVFMKKVDISIHKYIKSCKNAGIKVRVIIVVGDSFIQ